jgi:hypothetical protein
MSLRVEMSPGHASPRTKPAHKQGGGSRAGQAKQALMAACACCDAMGAP